LGTSFFLPRSVGFAKATELAMTGDELSARDAERFGLVAKVVPAEQLTATVQEFARKLALGPTKAIGLTKRALR
jgi:2-(1,2-epoxy-1,2-dihydrophenyl)acetyl-CoA isomerase